MPATPRSWLFAPGDSARKIEKAIAGEADAVILDLEDAVAPAAKPEARRMVADALRNAGKERARLWVRVNPLDGEWTQADLDAVVEARPAGIMLPKAQGRADMDTLDAMLRPLEEAHGLEALPVLPLVTETAAAMFTTGE